MRRRMLNPEFFTDSVLVALLDFGGRLFYQGLWCIAEDSGVFDPDLLSLKMKIFPGDNLDLSIIQNYYRLLVGKKKIIEFQVDGRTYAWLKNFQKHQKLDRPSPPSFPLPLWVIWHGETEFGKERHKYHYEILYLPKEDIHPDLSPTCPRLVPDHDTIEVKLNEVNRSEVKGNEVKLSEGDFGPSPIIDTGDTEKEVLQILASIPGYPFDETSDPGFIGSLAIEFPGLNLLTTVKQWALYRDKKPLLNKDDARPFLRKWCQLSVAPGAQSRAGPECPSPDNISPESG